MSLFIDREHKVIGQIKLNVNGHMSHLNVTLCAQSNMTSLTIRSHTEYDAKWLDQM